MQPEDVKRAIVEAERDSKRRQSRNAIIGLVVIVVGAIVGAVILLQFIPK